MAEDGARAVMTVLEAVVPEARRAELERVFAGSGGRRPPQLVSSYAVRDAADPSRWRLIGIWQSRAALEEYRKSVATPGGVMMFRSVGVEPALSIWEVVESGAAAQSEATGRDRGRERGQEMELQEVVQRFRAAADDFARGDPEPMKRLFSHREDVTLANPFGPAVHGWKRVAEALDFASARFRDGRVTSFETVASYVSPDLATFHEIERWEAKVAGRPEVSPFYLRVTTTYRLEDGAWRIAHRHADPIATAHPDGPLRPTGS